MLRFIHIGCVALLYGATRHHIWCEQNFRGPV